MSKTTPIDSATAKELYSNISKMYDSYIIDEDYKTSSYEEKDKILHSQVLEKSLLEYQNLLEKIKVNREEHREIAEQINIKTQLIINSCSKLRTSNKETTESPAIPIDLASIEAKEYPPPLVRADSGEEVDLTPDIHNLESVRRHHQQLLGNFITLIGNRQNGAHEDFKAASFIENNSIKQEGNEGLLYFLDYEDKSVISLYQTALDHNLPLAALRIIEACIDCETYKNPLSKPNPNELLPFILNLFLPLRGNQTGKTLEERCVSRTEFGARTSFFAQRIGMLKSQIDANLFEVTSVITLPPALPAPQAAPVHHRSQTHFLDIFRKMSITPTSRRSSNPQPVSSQSNSGFFANRRFKRALGRENKFSEKLNIMEAQQNTRFLGFSLEDLTKMYTQINDMAMRCQEKINKYTRDPVKYAPAKYAGIIQEYKSLLARINILKPDVRKAKSRMESMNMERTMAHIDINEVESSSKNSYRSR